ncbi:hypothetical protein FVE85_8335 [Porphyridium purpureum]|uniref:Phytanoyl-CoA dioxygenase family protein n=1 Tax=Porphyridium purpureum TaxID=35688 RepID=A0A5J4YMG2_PORPP|nr:hypothetical protein FVE85_8335 [Porphyridium purpureum]|eukprot:POR7029..scf244_11
MGISRPTHQETQHLVRQRGGEMGSLGAGLSTEQRYLFDVRGYVILRHVLSPEECKELHDAIDANADAFHERTGNLMNSTQPPFVTDSLKGRLDCGTMLHWSKPYCDVFRRLLTHPNVVPALVDVCGPGFRLDHLPLCVQQRRGVEGFDLHGGNLDASGNYNEHLAYTFKYGQMKCRLVNCTFQLTRVDAGDGGFAIIPGSHKANYPLPPGIANGSFTNGGEPLLEQPVVEQGDVILFSEGTSHGALPWRGAADVRRVVFYRYAPGGVAYGRGYLDRFLDEAFLSELTPQQRAVLAPPYHSRLERPLLGKDAQTLTEVPRPAHKKAFDEKLFGYPYF